MESGTARSGNREDKPCQNEAFTLCMGGHPRQSQLASRTRNVFSCFVYLERNHNWKLVQILPLSNSMTMERIDGKANHE